MTTRPTTTHRFQREQAAVRAFDPPPAPRTPKAARTRARLLEVAAGLFVNRGFAAVSIRDIADQAELSNGAVYGHFRTKGQLLIEVLRWRFADRDADQRQGFDSLRDEHGREIRVLLVDAAAAARHDADIAAGLASFYAERLDRTRAILSDVVGDAEAVTWLLATIWAGIGASESAGLPLPSDEEMRDIMTNALRGFGPPDKTKRRSAFPTATART